MNESTTYAKAAIATPSGSRKKRVRHRTSDDLIVEELLLDDMAYDADTEAIQPDGYEDAESDAEPHESKKRKFDSIDELSTRLKHLGYDHDHSECSTPQTSGSVRGRRKRIVSSEFRNRGVTSPELEILELVDRSEPSPPRKRTRHGRASSLDICRPAQSRPSRHCTAHSGPEQTDHINDAMDIT